jgi:DNA-binding NarL/FixJ family response regulator
MKEGERGGPIRIALLTEPGLSDALARALADVSGLALVSDPALADVLLIAARAPAIDEQPALTPREHEVLRLLAEGASNKTIAQTLAISVRTAKFHVSQIIDKLDAIGRTDAVAQAARIGVIRL